jgi:hypothetical protein
VTIAAVQSLGEEIEATWSANDYEAGPFADICVRVLEKTQLHSCLSPDAIVRWALSSPPTLPAQMDRKANFGQPPVTVFRSRRFHIDALFWVDGTTSIHDHGFSGAFQVLAGSSIETAFQFQPIRNVGDQLCFGDLTVIGSRFLRQGDIRPIMAGPSFIHSLFHLHRPTVSLVVRTSPNARSGAQLAYLPPGIAHNPFFDDEALERWIQIIELLRLTDDPSFDDQVGSFVARSDLHTAFTVISSCNKLRDRTRLARLIDRVRDPSARQLFFDWISAAERLHFLKSRRTMVHDPDLRFLLAVLLNAHRREDVLSLVAAYTAAVPPARQVATWLAKLSTVAARLQLASGRWEPNLLGLPSFTPRREEALVAALEGEKIAAADQETDFLKQLRALPHLQPLFR